MYVNTIPLALLIVLFVMGFVYWDTTRRGLPRRTCYLWTGCISFVSFSVFFLSMFAIDDFLIRLYLDLRGYERLRVFHSAGLINLLFKFGVAMNTLIVLVYVVGSRYGPLVLQIES